MQRIVHGALWALLHGEADVSDPIGMMIIINCNGGKIASQFVNFVVFVAEISTRRSCSISVLFSGQKRRKIVWYSVTSDYLRWELVCMCSALLASVQTLAHERRAHINGKTALLGLSCIRIDAMCSQPVDWPNSHFRFGYGRWRDAALSFTGERRLPPISRTCTTNFRLTIVFVCNALR